jgi:UPF0288 family protein (methanogenesis marker protein 3)
MTETKKRKGGKRRADALCEQDRVKLAEKIITEKKPVTEVAAELGLQPRTAQRLATQGLREVLGDPSPKRAELFTTIATIFTEVLEELQRTVDFYKSAAKPVPTRVLQTKIQAAVGLARTCGFGTDQVFVDKSHAAPTTINFTVVGRNGERRVVDVGEFSARRPVLELAAAPEPEPQSSAPPAPEEDSDNPWTAYEKL